jgi:hypothetical protein
MFRKPNFFIVGAPKCGTTSLYDALGNHPDVYWPARKELHFFGSDHHRTHRAPHDLAWYESYYAQVKNESRVGDASTSYLHSRMAPSEIQTYSPAAKIVIMLRNPVDVMYALHSTNLKGGFENIWNFEDALDAESDRKNGRRWPDRNGILENLFYREMASFPPQVSRYFDVFGRERVHVILYDEFRRDAASVVRTLLEFLELEERTLPIPHKNPNQRPRSRRLHDFVFHPPPLARRIGGALMPVLWRRAISRRVGRANLTVVPRPPMPPALRETLVQEFAPQVEALGRILERDLAAWNG